MNNLLQTVLETYPKYHIEKQVSSSYVEMYTKEKSDIILVYAKVLIDLIHSYYICTKTF